MNNPYILLNNGIKMPQLGLGVWQTKDGAEVESAVGAALKAGYRLIDTAAVYGNEAGVGAAIAHSGIARDELFITTKVWNADQGYDNTLVAFEKSLKRLNLDYIDLYLIHWPVPARSKYIETWRALEKLYKDGRVKAIGVSNFTPEYLKILMETATVTPAVNQVELHPQFPQLALRQFCETHGIAVEAYSPLGSGKNGLLTHPLLEEIGNQYQKSPAQVILRWHIQNNLIAIPKSVTPERIVDNISIFDFSLSGDDLRQIDTLTTNQRIGASPEDANFV